MGKTLLSLLAVTYNLMPEFTEEMDRAWLARQVLTGAGVLAAYVFVRLRMSRCGNASRSASAVRWAEAGLCLAVGAVVSAGLWLVFDWLRAEDFLGELWAALPPENENTVKGLLLVGCGWAGWAVAIGEVFQLLAQGQVRARWRARK